MKLGLTADQVLTTTRSVRKRLDFDTSVNRAEVEQCLEIALQAPTGSNRQGWHFLVIEDPARKRKIADIYARNFETYSKMAASNDYQPGDPRYEQRDAITDSARYLTENFHRAPLLLIPCIEGDLNRAPAFRAASAWGSLLPAVWSFMLALRERGMGSAWTTIHLLNGGDAEAAKLLKIPHPDVTQAGLFPIAKTVGTDFKPARRLPLQQVIHWDTW